MKLSGIIILSTITFLLFPLQSESVDVYSYADENGVTVTTNTPWPDKIINKARKIESYKDVAYKDRIQSKTAIRKDRVNILITIINHAHRT